MSDIDKALEELRNGSVEQEVSKSPTRVPEVSTPQLQDEQTLIQEKPEMRKTRHMTRYFLAQRI